MVSLLTALIIQANEAEVTTYGPEDKKYGFEIYSMIREKYRPHLTSQPVFESKEIAKEEGEKVLEQIQEFDLDIKRKELSGLVGDAGPAIAEVIDASKK
ncbi:hypothetical protein KAI04_04600 [Candidatus Pacearchaeota archaeon]|nr:hypothetical protein [Candidatus Pacearchaeota archaeon]